LLETVGGYRPPDESAAEVARRESLEETGCELGELIHIGDFYVSPGLSSERIALFCARVDAAQADGIHGLAHEGEEIRVVVLSFAEAQAALFQRINSTSVIIAMQWLAAEREVLRRRWC
jgi:ADP-ribose pyrophosphatase